MPVSYKIDEERRVVITTGWGVVTGDECLEHQRQLGSDARFNSDFFQLADFTRVTGVQIDLSTVMKLADLDLFSGKARRAFLAPNPLAYGFSRMFIAARRVTGVEQMRVFRDRDEALGWLRLNSNCQLTHHLKS